LNCRHQQGRDKDDDTRYNQQLDHGDSAPRSSNRAAEPNVRLTHSGLALRRHVNHFRYSNADERTGAALGKNRGGE
jgi:hypothetical protein